MFASSTFPVPLSADLRRQLYNTREWREQRERVLARAFLRCECLGECGRLHPGPLRRCGELHGQAGLFQGGVVVLQCAHVRGLTGQRVEDGDLRALCARCHFGVDEALHQRIRRSKRTATLEANGQMRLL